MGYRFDMAMTVANVVLPTVTFAAGFLISERQIKKQRKLDEKKEKFYEFYLPASKKLFDRVMYDSIYIPLSDLEGEDRETTLTGYHDVVYELAAIRHYASDRVNALIAGCHQQMSDDEAFMECFHELISAVESEGKRLANDLGYSYLSPSEYGALQDSPAGQSCRRAKRQARE